VNDGVTLLHSVDTLSGCVTTSRRHR
jgi:hypothetical protein